MGFEKKISICIPTYQHGDFVAIAIESALNQVYPAFEIIVSNDCSTDNTNNILKKYDELVTIINQEKNLGMSNNYRFLIEKARGNYIVLLSDDDALHPNFLKKVIPYCNNHAMVTTGRFDCDKNLKPIRYAGWSFIKYRSLMPDKGFYLFLDTCKYGLSGTLWNRKWMLSLPQLPQEAEFSFDWYAAILTGAFHSIAMLLNPLVYYRFHDNNYSHSNAAKMKTSAKAMFEYISTLSMLDKKKRSLAKGNADNYNAILKNAQDSSHNVYSFLKRNIASIVPYFYKHPSFNLKKKAFPD